MDMFVLPDKKLSFCKGKPKMKGKLASEDLDKVLGILIEKNQDFDDLVFDLSNFLEMQAENNEASDYHRLCTFFKKHSFLMNDN
ncbi:MAG: hypothetical protein IBX64_02110 [Actinobacteria bacterium]|nr:hypothetical protein [Actinomycetota bacterium]